MLGKVVGLWGVMGLGQKPPDKKPPNNDEK
jgi:hypothetical protein